jgi:hypothetical protein
MAENGRAVFCYGPVMLLKQLYTLASLFCGNKLI